MQGLCRIVFIAFIQKPFVKLQKMVQEIEKLKNMGRFDNNEENKNKLTINLFK